MVYNKGQPHMSKAEKAECKKKEKEEKQREEVEKRAAAARYLEEARAKAGIILNQKKGRQNGHNCPQKDASKTHRLTQRCFKQGHAGLCHCGYLHSAKDGCKKCKAKGSSLRYENISLD